MVMAHSPKAHILWVDYVRLMAMFAVILVHVADPYVLSIGDSIPEHWWSYQFYDALGRLATPCFFMISGLLLLEKQEPFGVFFRKRISKVVIPLIAWTVIYAVLQYWSVWDWGEFVRTLGLSIFSPVSPHLWFLYAMIGIYLFVPFLRILVQHSERRMLWFYVGLWFLAVAVIPSITYFIPTRSWYDLDMISGHIGYLVLGLLLGKMRLNKRHALIAVGVFITMLAINVLGTGWLSLFEGQYTRYVITRLHPTTILYSAAFFVLVRYIVESAPQALKQVRLPKWVQLLNATNYGIYLVHVAIFNALIAGSFGFTMRADAWGHPLYTVPLIALFIMLMASVVTWVLQRIPLIKHVVP